MQKAIIILIVIGGLILAATSYHKWYYDKAYNAGFNTAAVQYQTASQEALDSRISEVKQRLEATIDRQQTELESLQELNKRQKEQQQRIEVVYREIPKVVERSDCKRIGMESMQLFNTIIGDDPATEKQ